MEMTLMVITMVVFWMIFPWGKPSVERKPNDFNGTRRSDITPGHQSWPAVTFLKNSPSLNREVSFFRIFWEHHL